MKTNLLVAVVVSFIAGAIGSNVITPAHALMGNNVIKLITADEVLAQCDFNKTIVNASRGSQLYLCVKK